MTSQYVWPFFKISIFLKVGLYIISVQVTHQQCHWELFFYILPKTFNDYYMTHIGTSIDCLVSGLALERIRRGCYRLDCIIIMHDMYLRHQMDQMENSALY